VELDGKHVEEELAAFANQIVANRCWHQFVRYYANRRLTLRNGARVIREYLPRGSRWPHSGSINPLVARRDRLMLTVLGGSAESERKFSVPALAKAVSIGVRIARHVGGYRRPTITH
jgi:hypothetical protein